MKRVNHQMTLLGLAAVMACCGCQSFGKTTVRGQNPGPISPGVETQNGRGLYHTPFRSAAAEMQDVYHEHHNTTTHYYGGDGLQGQGGYGYPAMGGASCPPYYAEASCPPGGYPGGACRHGGCRHHCQWGCRGGICNDKMSYGYEAPNDLVYPPQGGVGGAVVYPYYTHKGPSDFFRTE